jgi:uncharacterized OsmC-like protein
MPTILNHYEGNLRSRLEHIKSKQLLITDAPTDNKGKGESFSPTDTVAGALSACMMTIMGIKANDANVDLSGLKSSVTKIMTDNPRRIAEIHIEFNWENCTANEKHKTILKRAAITCPVALSLHPAIKQEIIFNF